MMGLKQGRVPKRKSACRMGSGGFGAQFYRNFAPACPITRRGPGIGLSMRIKSCLRIREMNKKGNSRQYNLF